MLQENFPSIWAVVPAAGIGSRMRSELPKQYLPLLGKTLLENTLEKLLTLTKIKGIVLALHPEDTYWEKTSLVNHQNIHCVVGGDERSESVINALEYCYKEKLVESSTWALVHDAARPCVSVEKIEELILFGLDCQKNNQSVGAILAVPVSDTVKRAGGNKILKTEDRSQLWLAHTPQFFPSDILLNALLECRKRDISITDEASALESLGMGVCLLKDRRDNIKVTVPEDLVWAETILKKQRETIQKEQGERL